MDDLKKGFKGLWNKASNQVNKATGTGFKGSGQRLGTAEERGERAKVHGQGAVSSQQPDAGSSGNRPGPSGRPAATTAAPAARSATPDATVRARPANIVQEPITSLAPSAEFNPFAATLGTGAALNTIRAEEAPVDTAPGPSHPSRLADTDAVTAEHVEEMQHALALIVSQPRHGSSLEVLQKLLANLAARPEEPKFRQVRLSNAKVQEAVVQVAGGLELLQAVGFDIHLGGGAEGEAGFAAFPDDTNLPLVHEGLRQLRKVIPSQSADQQTASGRASPATSSSQQPGASNSGFEATASASGAPASQQASHDPAGPSAATLPTPTASIAAAAAAAPTARGSQSAAGGSGVSSTPLPSPPRNLQVLLPVAPDTDVPVWFFERTGADIKAEYFRLLKSRQESQMFTMRSPSPAQPPSNRRIATLRIRFPEGVTLQGDFGASEPLTAVFEFVTAALRDPATTYELALPLRRVLSLAGRVADVPELLPSALLNFRRLGGQGQQQQQQRVPFLQDALLQQARLT